MKGMSRILLGLTIVSVLPLVAEAAGTYYNGSTYQNPQNKYSGLSTNSNGGGYYNTYGAGSGRGYGQNQNMQNLGTTKSTVRMVQKTTTTTTKSNNSQKKGWILDANLSHEFASWGFDMKKAGSKLHYDNLRWNAINAELGYYFGDSTPMQVKIGGKYGVQFDESPMVDDDISSDAMWVNWGNNVIEGTPAVSIGTSKGGTEYGYNAEFGLTNFFEMGRVKVTPSIGYRYFKHNLKTKSNRGAMINVVNSPENVNCIIVQDGEIQCGPYVGFSGGGFAGFQTAAQAGTDTVTVYDIYGNQIYLVVDPTTGNYIVQNGGGSLDLGTTYYYEQHGVSHKYETEWYGPYIAFDLEYIIDNDNIINAGLEFGLPIYDSKGDQPYRFDWQHPTSVEDKGGLGDAVHLGLNAEWATTVSDNVMFTLGLDYDYYRVGGASATTYLNPNHYYNLLQNGLISEDDYNVLQSKGWKDKVDNEITSVYKSMGIHAGVKVKF